MEIFIQWIFIEVLLHASHVPGVGDVVIRKTRSLSSQWGN